MSEKAVEEILEGDWKGGGGAALGCAVGLLAGVGAALGLRYGLGWGWLWAGLAGGGAFLLLMLIVGAIAEPLVSGAAAKRIVLQHGVSPKSLYGAVFNVLAGEPVADVGGVLRVLDAGAYRREKRLLGVLEGRWKDVGRKERSGPEHEKKLMDAVFGAAGHEDARVRVGAADVLARFGIAGWGELIQGEREDFGRLAGSDEPGVIAALHAALKNDGIAACAEAARVLGTRGGEETVSLLRQALRHRHSEVAKVAGESLARLGVDTVMLRPKGPPQRTCRQCGEPLACNINRVTLANVVKAAIVSAVFVGVAAVTYNYTRGWVFKVAVVLAVLSVLGVLATLRTACRGSFSLTLSCGGCGYETSGEMACGSRWEAEKHFATEYGTAIAKGTFVMCNGGLYRSKTSVPVKKGKALRNPDKDAERWDLVCTPDYEALPEELKEVWYYG